jgi:hypothetical protein
MIIIKPHSQTGFAIVEVLIATVVLAIGFIELTRAFKNISSVAVRAVAMTRASNLTHATMERVMSHVFDARGNDLEFGDYALEFDGIDDWVNVSAVHENIQTISFWIQADFVNGTRPVMDLNGAAYITIVDGEVTVVGNNSPKYYINGKVDEQTITADVWYHVAVTTTSAIDASGNSNMIPYVSCNCLFINLTIYIVFWRVITNNCYFTINYCYISCTV